MLNILVAGSNGQLGKSIEDIHDQYAYRFYFTDKNTLDILNKKQIQDFVKQNNIDVIINCAAYTAVDKAEDEKDLADQVNHIAVGNIAKICKESGIKLIHISTDYVFDGKNYKPYMESDEVFPNSVYGKSKLEGELSIQKINPKGSVILRTSWMYSLYGKNFLKTIIKLAGNKDKLDVVFDQIGTPTYASDLAKAILDIISQLGEDDVEVYHYSNEGVASWYDFALSIVRILKIECEIAPIETKNYPTPAKRPYFSLLNKGKIKNRFDLKIPHWEESLEHFLKNFNIKDY